MIFVSFNIFFNCLIYLLLLLLLSSSLSSCLEEKTFSDAVAQKMKEAEK